MDQGTNQSNKPQQLFGFLTVRNLIEIVTIAVSIALAWGVFSTRVTLLEHNFIALKEENVKRHEELKLAESKIAALERAKIEDRYMIDELWLNSKGHPPRRSR